MMPAFDVSVVGELNLDMIMSGLPKAMELDREYLARDFNVTLGSSSAILAHNLASLGSKVAFSSSIGGDSFGEICLRYLGASGADLSRVRRFDGQTTGVTIILPSGTQRYILTYPGTMATMSYTDLDLRYALDAKHFHLSSYFLHRTLRPQIPKLFREAKKAGLTTSLDTNDDPDGQWTDDLLEILPFVDVLLPNEREACLMVHLDDVNRAAEILSQRVPLLVIKQGEKGAFARRGNETFTAPPLTVAMTDPIGAGDSFDAGFLHQFVRGQGIETCLRFANVTGALCATRAGGIEAFRDAEHRGSFLQENWKENF
jgi:sugar/nucleoside kinase (ribokinase family)